MSGCPPPGFVSPNAATILEAESDLLNLTHVLPILETFVTHVHYEAFVNVQGDNGQYGVLYPPMINMTLKWDPDAPFGPPPPSNGSASPAWLPTGRECNGTTAVYHTWPVPAILLDGRAATSDFVTVDWYYIRSDDGATGATNHLESSTFVVLKAPAPPPPPPPTPSSSNTTGSTTPSGEVGSASASTSSGVTTPEEGGPTSQDHGVSANAALALKIVMPILVVGMAFAIWTWWRRRKSPGKDEGVFGREMAQEADGVAVTPAAMQFEKAELSGGPVVVATTAQSGEHQEQFAVGMAGGQTNQQVESFGTAGHLDRGRVMSFELEAPLYSGSRGAERG
ncbi:uncharacterized protein B0I36DRAFT_363520 [Microdochium trichocladiopsis]|uniref:Uncharacterized protein n=1 Tax=Microdochium trichocladiopsis TaxID=1682393 RepID=A0A9P8Y3V5_9PEZI|nr:uncharacterized protein B0I36DRAFT_363520 [Microdochium trichocladiopsis]KAH7028909.1 hypothetical protein B0I36DRAFT_363520 [Microdochium trichocladiopsis]